jgi:predicted RNA-binding Zn-ribbon protein involved in translation (DUF1610 family)
MGFDAVVNLKPASVEPTKPPKHQLSIQLSTKNAKQPNQRVERVEKEREREERERSKGVSKEGDLLKSDQLTHSPGESCLVCIAGSDDSDDPCKLAGKPCLACIAGSPDIDKQDKKPECVVCGTDISPGRGSYGADLCPACGPQIALVRAAMKSHMDGITITTLHQELADRGRAPTKVILEKMLGKLGCHVDGDTWTLGDAKA